MVPRQLLLGGEAWPVSRAIVGSEQEEVSSYPLLSQEGVCEQKRAGTLPQSHCQP